MTEGAASPRSAWRAAATSALLALVVMGCVTGLGRYLEGREHQGEQLEALAAAADAVASLGASPGLDAVTGVSGQVADAVDVIVSGQTDAFGIARGAEVKLTHRAGRASTPIPSVDAEALKARMSALAEVPSGAPAPPRLRFEARVVDGGEPVLLSAHASIVGSGEAGGMVRVSAWQTPSPDPIHWWRLGTRIRLSSALQ